MALTIDAYTGSATIGTTEWSLTTNTAGPDADTTDGIYQIFLDLSAMAAGDKFELKLYEKVRSTSTQRAFLKAYFYNAQDPPNYPTPSFILGHGWDATLVKIAGTDRSIEWRISRSA